MRRFASLFQQLDSTTKTSEKVAAMSDYLSAADPSDAAWAVYFLSGNKRRRVIPTKLLREWAAGAAEVPEWLFNESYHTVGDLAETISLIVPPGQSTDDCSLTDWIESRVLPLRTMEPEQQRLAILEIWQQTTAQARLVVMKLLTGSFRVGVSKGLVTRALAQASNVPAEVIAHRLMGDWEPSSEFFRRVVDPDTDDTTVSQPYPFCLAHPIDVQAGPQTLGDPSDFVAEWKWDGIRGQLIRRQGKSFLWSRGEELMEKRWPEIESAAEQLPDGTVLDGEILACQADGTVLPFAQLQRRIGRKKVGKKLLSEVPVVFHAFDILEHDGEDIRGQTLVARRQRLEQVLATVEDPHICATELITGDSWEAWGEIRESSREHRAEGLMLKSRAASYDVGRVRGTWWKWKVAPYTIDAVLIYAQKGHGKRASLFTDYTFALWDGDALIPFAKAYSGLDNREIRQVDRFVRDNTQEKFGPVRSVRPELVMELAFEGLQVSSRHRSGVATRFPRILRWRHDKQPKDANTLAELKSLLPHEPSC